MEGRLWLVACAEKPAGEVLAKYVSNRTGAEGMRVFTAEDRECMDFAEKLVSGKTFVDSHWDKSHVTEAADYAVHIRAAITKPFPPPSKLVLVSQTVMTAIGNLYRLHPDTLIVGLDTQGQDPVVREVVLWAEFDKERKEWEQRWSWNVYFREIEREVKTVVAEVVRNKGGNLCAPEFSDAIETEVRNLVKATAKRIEDHYKARISGLETRLTEVTSEFKSLQSLVATDIDELRKYHSQATATIEAIVSMLQQRMGYRENSEVTWVQRLVEMEQKAATMQQRLEAAGPLLQSTPAGDSKPVVSPPLPDVNGMQTVRPSAKMPIPKTKPGTPQLFLKPKGDKPFAAAESKPSSMGEVPKPSTVEEVPKPSAMEPAPDLVTAAKKPIDVQQPSPVRVDTVSPAAAEKKPGAPDEQKGSVGPVPQRASPVVQKSDGFVRPIPPGLVRNPAMSPAAGSLPSKPGFPKPGTSPLPAPLHTEQARTGSIPRPKPISQPMIIQPQAKPPAADIFEVRKKQLEQDYALLSEEKAKQLADILKTESGRALSNEALMEKLMAG